SSTRRSDPTRHRRDARQRRAHGERDLRPLRHRRPDGIAAPEGVAGERRPNVKDDAKADLARFIDRWTIEYVRTYPHPIERVWRAITDPEQFRAWFIRGYLEPKVGGAYRFGDEHFSGSVTAIEPPTLVRLCGPQGAQSEGYFQYELAQVDGGTRMRFVQHFAPGHFEETPDDLGGDLPGGPDTPWKPGFVGGWHEFWDALGDYLDGVATGSR